MAAHGRVAGRAVDRDPQAAGNLRARLATEHAVAASANEELLESNTQLSSRVQLLETEDFRLEVCCVSCPADVGRFCIPAQLDRVIES